MFFRSVMADKKQMIIFVLLLSFLPYIVLIPYFGEQVQAAGTNPAEILESSPIDKAYAGNEYVLFLHKDTSVSGFGSNISNVLGMPGGEGSNTGELIKVAGPTGFSDIIPGRETAFGLKPVHEKDTYKIFWFNENIDDVNKRWESKFEVKDFATIANSGGNPHQASAYIDEDGYIRQRGSDYFTTLAIGSYYPFNRSNGPGPSTFIIDADGTNNWHKVLAPGGEDVIYPENGEGYFLSNENNTSELTMKISEPFEVKDDQFSIEIYLRDFAKHPSEPRSISPLDSIMTQVLEVYDGNLTDAQINSGNFAPIARFDRPNFAARGDAATGAPDRVQRVVDVSNVETDIFKIKHSTRYVKWDIRVRERVYFENAKRISYGNSRGLLAVIDENGDVYMNNKWPTLRKVNFPLDVEVDPDTLSVDGDNNQFAIIDKKGRLWTFNSLNPSVVNFPKVDGAPFYENYKIIDVSVGNNFILAISEHRETGETNVWSWGLNSHGKLGLEGVEVGTNVATPRMVTKEGKPMKNIQTVAAGQHFSIIVQNTDEGQLVWSAGRNNSGQLGGNLKLRFDIPKIVPGLYGADRVVSRVFDSYVLNDKNETIYKFGGSTSHPIRYNIPSSVGHPQYMNEAGRYGFPTEGINQLYFIGSKQTGGKVHIYRPYMGIGGATTEYDFVKPHSGIVYDSSGKDTNVNYRNMFNEGKDYFENVKSVTVAAGQGLLVDKNGRLWAFTNAGRFFSESRMGIGYWYNTNGTEGGTSGYFIDEPNVPNKNLAFPTKISQNQFTAPIYEFVVSPTWITNLNNSYAVDKYGKLWRTGTLYVEPIDSSWAINDVKIVEGFSGYRHAFLLDENGEIWAFGEGNYGKKGVGSTITTETPIKIDKSNFDGEKIVFASAGKDHSLFVTESGNVYGVGSNANNKLGFEDSKLIFATPVKIPNLPEIKYVKAGDEYSLAVDKDGRVWAWGYAAEGSLGDNFPISRGFLSTAAGNDLPIMTIDTEIKDYFLSKNGIQEFTLHGTIIEREKETTEIKVELLGEEKKFVVNSDEWELDIYDEVIPKQWSITWNVENFDDGEAQLLTVVNANDERGGIIQQFFAGKIAVDNSAPYVPTWGDTCILNEKREETSCYSEPYFSHQGENAVNKPIRLYMNVQQKSGHNKAPTLVQYQYRKYHPHGYINDWSEWITVKNKNTNGFYEDFFEGFLGEHQIRIRAIDEAGNVSSIQPETRYTIIDNAGAEVKKITGEPHIKDNKLYNIITIEGMSPDSSKIISYSVKRHEVGDVDEKGEKIWVDLTNGRATWDSDDNKLVFVDDDGNLKGNTEYIYSVDLENSITVGKSKEVSVITEVYEPVNFIRVPTEEGIDVSITQSERNKGDILYRLVLIESRTGLTAQFDYVSSKREEDVIYRVKESDVRKYKLKNNKIDILLVYKGANGNYHTITYDKEFNLNEKILNDVVPPSVTFDLGIYKRINENDSKKIELTLFASDNATAPGDLQVQFSKDGSKWYGYREGGRWVENHWGVYQTTYKNFDVSDLSGRHMIYARVRDEAGNIGYDSQEILIAQNAKRDNEKHAKHKGSTYGSVDEKNRIHVNTNNIELEIPKSGDLTEVQYSFDGVQWFDWEPIPSNGIKYIELTQGEGQKAVYTRYRNKHESVTPVKEKDIIRYVLDYSPPSLKFKTGNGTRITNTNKVLLLVTASDNFSNVMLVSLDSSDLKMKDLFDNVFISSFEIQVNTVHPIVIEGLRDGFNDVEFVVKDRAGNQHKESIRIYKKDD